MNSLRYTSPGLYTSKSSGIKPLKKISDRIARPTAHWPDYILEIARQRIPAEGGVGDTVERIIGQFGSDAFKIWYAEAHPRGVNARTCKCSNWKPIWNTRFNYQQIPIDKSSRELLTKCQQSAKANPAE